MAKINLPLMSQIAKNKLGDVVFYRRGDFNINVARLRVIPANPKTEDQQKVRHNFSTLSKIWLGRIDAAGATLYKYDSSADTWTAITIADTETFGDTEKAEWADYVHVSKQGHKVTGKYSFIGVNMQRLYNNQNPWKTPGTEFTLAT